LEPALATECSRVFETCQAADLPDASPEVKAEVQAVEVSVEQVHNAATTAAQLLVPEATELQTVLTQTAGVAAPVAQELALRAQATFTEAQAAFAAYDPVRAEATLKAFQDECRTRGVDPSAFLGGGGEQGGLDFTRIACDPRGDFIGSAVECHIVVENYREIAGQLGGGFEMEGMLMDRGKMLEQIQGMNVSEEDRTKMLETFHACDAYVREGNFAGVREVMEAKARDAYEHAMAEMAQLSPEQRSQFEAIRQTGDWTQLEALREQYGMGIGPFTEGYHGGPMGMGTQEFYAMGGMEFGGQAPTTGMLDPATVHALEAMAVSSGGTVDSTTAGSGGTTTENQAVDNKAADTYCPYGHDPVTNVCKTSP
jgi:hypothetical protein